MINESLKTKQAETVRNDRFDRICSGGRHISKRATDYIPAPKGKGEKVKEMKNYVIGVKNGRCVVASEKEIIENALQQEKDGVKPHYSFYDYKKGEKATPAGWFVWSAISYGCGVVYRRNDGKMIISTGIQGDFCYC